MPVLYSQTEEVYEEIKDSHAGEVIELFKMLINFSFFRVQQ